MTVLEKAPEFKALSNHTAGLIVDPMDITFDDLSSDLVMIRVEVRNEGKHRTSPTFMRLESAPFGAFVPRRPLAVLPVPELEPGESRELSVVATRPHPTPLGDFNRVQPRSMLTAQGISPNQTSPQPGAGFASALLNLMRRQGTSHPARGLALPPDLWELTGRKQPHWAGNIHVFVGDRAVERHFAKALRIYSGRTNLAMLDVGGPNKRDAYAFELVGLAPDWKAALHDMTGSRTLVVHSTDQPLQEKQWVEGNGMMMIMLAVRPPVICEECKLDVHVTRRSCGKTAVVEFGLDPTAQGAGCYVA